MTTASRLFVLAAAITGACAFPASINPVEKIDAGGDEPSGCDFLCAGRCDTSLLACVGSDVGGSCRLDGDGDPCVSGAICSGGLCVQDPAGCDGGECPCLEACAGRCVSGTCAPGTLGDTCNTTGAGSACGRGLTCTGGSCVLAETVPPVALVDFLSKYRAATCTWLTRCGRFPDTLASECGTFVAGDRRLFGSVAEAVAAVGRAEASYDKDAAGLCVFDVERLPCDGSIPTRCLDAFVGRAAEGAKCSSDATCMDELSCVSSDFSGVGCAGKCAPRLRLGEDCSSGRCAKGLVCHLASGLHRCVVDSLPGRAGSACAPGAVPCDSGFFCAGDGKCRALKLRGDPCTETRSCGPGLICPAAPNEQATCVSVSKRDEACTSSLQCSPPDALVATDACVLGKCTALPTSGACATDPRLVNRCDPTTAYCNASTQCTTLVGDGGVCEGAAACGKLSGRVCVFGTCNAPLECVP